MSMRSLITTKLLKDAEYDSKLFKVVEIHKPHPLLNKLKKTWENDEFLYIKNKYLPENMENQTYYKMRIFFDEFNKDGKDITYICKVRTAELPDYQEPRENVDFGLGEDSD